MRQLGQAIGSANTNVVAYHFGTKDDLVVAVIRQRLTILEARRAELLAKLPNEGANASLSDLLDVLYRPFFEQTNDEGKHSYVAFLASLIRSDLMPIRAAMSDEFPVTQKVIDGLVAHTPKSATPVLSARMQVMTQMVFAYLQHIDQRGLTGPAAESAFADCLRVVRAALEAPSQ